MYVLIYDYESRNSTKKTVIIGVSKFESALELLESPTQVCPEESHEKSDLLH